MDFILIPILAFLASILTFFSGFGLGTILTPVFAVFFPIELAIAMTAIVHFLNGVFKFVLTAKHIHKGIVIRFGIPAICSALIGAWLLPTFADLPTIATFELFQTRFVILPVKILIACILIAFTCFEILPALKKLQFSPKYLTLGGILTGFFGGLSGHQGALRSAFLVKTNLTKEQLIATGVGIAMLIDIGRLVVYAKYLNTEGIAHNLSLLVVTCLSAFIGAYLGNKLLKKVTLHRLQQIISISLIVFAIALALGMV
jgi:uncharacterized protein